MIRAYPAGLASFGWKQQLKLMLEAHSLPYEAAKVAFTLNPEPMKFVLEGKRGPRGGRGRLFYNEDSAWPLRWTQMYEKGDVHAVWPILKRMKGALDGAKISPVSMAAWGKTARLAVMYDAGPSALLKMPTPSMFVYDEFSFIGKGVPDLLTLGASMPMPKEKSDDPS